MRINHGEFAKLRESQLLTRAEVAQRGGVHPTTIARLEEGGNIHLTSLRMVLEGLGLTVDEAVERGLLTFDKPETVKRRKK